jgi:hypothetical protein
MRTETNQPGEALALCTVRPPRSRLCNQKIVGAPWQPPPGAVPFILVRPSTSRASTYNIIQPVFYKTDSLLTRTSHFPFWGKAGPQGHTIWSRDLVLGEDNFALNFFNAEAAKGAPFSPREATEVGNSQLPHQTLGYPAKTPQLGRAAGCLRLQLCIAGSGHYWTKGSSCSSCLWRLPDS